ncbi:MAG: M20/M25/M40 family metallo-hydrolase [Clostridia bacterium]|nr:M20/M25/M40 family metallo-hydrolase [Clostridia bacterium]
MIDRLKKLTETYGPSGNEGEIRNVIADMIKPCVDEMKVDALGNLIARKKGEGPVVMLAAHMDQIGFVVTEADKHGFLRVHNVGGIYKTNSLNRRVVFKNGISGIVSCEQKDKGVADPTMKKLFVDIGASSREEALKAVSIGDMAVYAPDWAEIGKGLYAAPAMDDRAGCCVLIETLLRLEGQKCDIVCVFTTQEEVGLRGATAAAYEANPEIGIAIDVTPACDVPGSEKLPVKLDKGIAVKIMDRSLIAAPRVVEGLESAAEKAKATCQREVLTYGGTDAGVIHTTRAGVMAGVLSIPCRYVHSACETVSAGDMEQGVKTLVEYLKSF